MSEFDISMILSFHSEGRLAEASLKASCLAVEYAKSRGKSVELIFAVDRPNNETNDYCKRNAHFATQYLELDFDSLSKSRNYCAQMARGELLAFFDADDLCSENWLYASHELMLQTDETSVFHPETIVHFEGRKLLVRALESRDLEFVKERMWPGTLWNCTCCVKRDLFLNNLFEEPDMSKGFGYEDWLWTCETLAAGISHRVVPNTIFCYRVKTWQNSLYLEQEKSHLVLGKNSLYALPFQNRAGAVATETR